MSKEEQILSHQGHLDFETIGHLIQELKTKSTQSGYSINTYKKLLSAMVESVENIEKYNDNFIHNPYLTENFLPSLTIIKSEDGFEITTGNPIKKTDVKPFQEKIEQLNALSKDEVKKLYRETVINGQFSPKGGAGLGLIEIIKSGNQLNYQVNPIDEDYAYFIVKILVPTETLKH